MITQKLQSAINDQIQKELASAYLYLAMAAHLEDQNLPGAVHWMKEQYKEETGHAMKFFAYLGNRNARVTLEAIEKPKADYGSLRDVFQATLDHERKVTASINALYELALAEKDYPTQIELQWFIKEQVEEEKTIEDILVQIDACDGKPHLMLMIDHRLAKRGQ